MASFKAKFPVLQELFAKNHRGALWAPPPAGRGLAKNALGPLTDPGLLTPLSPISDHEEAFTMRSPRIKKAATANRRRRIKKYAYRDNI